MGGTQRGGYSVCAWPQSYGHRPSHPYYAGTEDVGFLPTRQALNASSAKRREVFGESQEGRTASFREPFVTRLRHHVPTFLLIIDDSASELCFVFWCGHSRDSNGYYYVTASWVPYHIYTTRCNHFPCAELGFSTPHNMIYSKTILVTDKKKNGTQVA